jgi:thiamine biosynthesis lipoprotein
LTEAAASITQSFKIMGGPAKLTVNTTRHDTRASEAVLENARVRLEELETRYSRFKPDSIVAQINARAGSGTFTPIDLEMHSLITLAQQLWHETGGLFDPTVGVLNQVWDFRAGQAKDPERLRSLLEKVGWDKVEWDERGIHLPQTGMELDLGGLVKEFAADAVAAMLREAGCTSALVELAGDIVAVGGQRHEKAWQIGIKDPKNPANSIASVRLFDAAICSSGNYARRFLYHGKSVSHLLHPQTGQPIEGPCSVSVIAESALMAGALATAACLHNVFDAKAWLDQSALPWLMVDAENQCLGPIWSAASN